ncbi:MAG: 5-(carboxyamino)imidazole ribonucleotide synthase [Gammaproteobacteria bacterium]|nr:5-(carboxyamino)imidazole ribonucleotide synthase [Gammaproteobacteria bacterium]MDH3560495.1 5-(carboxyamino)imidazole ribonucleotide synthase [Gammaproteobacteria bacterium]
MILPGATLGMIGGGQLGRMFTIAARSMGYQVIILDPDPHSPAGTIADQHIQADYNDHAALDMLGDYCAVVTTEFENISLASLTRLQQHCPVRPAPETIAMMQDRLLEKEYLDEHDFPTVAFYSIQTAEDLEDAMDELGGPGILKVARPGFPGQGQHAVNSLEEAQEAYQLMGDKPCILEERIFVTKHLSVILARSITADIESYPVSENEFIKGILDLSLAPARIEEEIADNAVEMACDLADKLDYCGVLTVELFLTEDGDLLVNTIAPRPHNSGHFTVDACTTSQFEQQVRTLCGLPPSDTQLLLPVAMVNLMGDLWANGTPRWEEVFKESRALLHLYGKRETKPGRKMGHINCLEDDVESALEMATSLRARLAP